MLKTTMRRTFIIFLLLAVACIPVTSATLSPISFGFPTMTQSIQSTAFNKATAQAFDFETADVSPFGTAGFGFPSVAQSSVQGQAINQVEFSQNTVVSAFSFPAVNTGLGLGGFGDFTGFGNLGHLF